MNLTLDHAIRPRGLRGSWLCNCKMRQQFSHYQRPFFGKAIDRVFKDTSELRNMEMPLEEPICRRYRKMLDEFSSIVEATNEVMRDKRRVHQLPMCWRELSMRVEHNPSIKVNGLNWKNPKLKKVGPPRADLMDRGSKVGQPATDQVSPRVGLFKKNITYIDFL